MMFFLFAVSVSWILVNVMLTIIIDGYEEVKKELEGQKNDLEVIQYIKVTIWFIKSSSLHVTCHLPGLSPEHGWLPGEASLSPRVCPRGLETRGAGGGQGRGGDTVRGHQLNGQ